MKKLFLLMVVIVTLLSNTAILYAENIPEEMKTATKEERFWAIDKQCTIPLYKKHMEEEGYDLENFSEQQIGVLFEDYYNRWVISDKNWCYVFSSMAIWVDDELEFNADYFDIFEGFLYIQETQNVRLGKIYYIGFDNFNDWYLAKNYLLQNSDVYSVWISSYYGSDADYTPYPIVNLDILDRSKYKYSLKDLVQIIKYTQTEYEYQSVIDEYMSDVNGDGDITVIDQAIIRRRIISNIE